MHSLQMTINHKELWSMKKGKHAYDWLLYNLSEIHEKIEVRQFSVQYSQCK